jgi:predicted Fe-Mo cluster-binding NifX family protein
MEVFMSVEKIAMPIDAGVLSAHFGHAQVFAIYHVENGAIIKKEELPPPQHEPGVIPKWLKGVGATTIITGGIGQNAINLFNSFGISVLSGAPEIAPEAVIDAYIKKTLAVSNSACKHKH